MQILNPADCGGDEHGRHLQRQGSGAGVCDLPGRKACERIPQIGHLPERQTFLHLPEKQTLVMEIPFSMLGSYDETAPGWILERGDYVIWAGNSLQSAIPVGTVLAQTWDTALVKQVGEMIGREREEFGVTLWLAPGMNIHRNPLVWAEL